MADRLPESVGGCFESAVAARSCAHPGDLGCLHHPDVPQREDAGGDRFAHRTRRPDVVDDRARNRGESVDRSLSPVGHRVDSDLGLRPVSLDPAGDRSARGQRSERAFELVGRDDDADEVLPWRSRL